MKLELNENPSFSNGENKTEEGMRNCIEVVPSLPTYHIEDIEVTRVLKYLFSPDSTRHEKMIVEYSMGFCEIIDSVNYCANFSCLPYAPDTMSAYEVLGLFVNCCFDIDLTERQLAIWGIKKVYMDESPTIRTASIHNLLEGLNRALSEETPSHVEIVCEDGEVMVGKHMFGVFKEEKLIELYKETIGNKTNN